MATLTRACFVLLNELGQAQMLHLCAGQCMDVLSHGVSYTDVPCSPGMSLSCRRVPPVARLKLDIVLAPGVTTGCKSQHCLIHVK